MTARGFHTLARRLGVPVVVGSTATRGLLDLATKAETLTGKDYALALAGSPSVLMETVPGLGMDSALTVDGISYTVRDVLRESDGALSRYFLSLVAAPEPLPGTVPGCDLPAVPASHDFGEVSG